jgi:hypothetical protein
MLPDKPRCQQGDGGEALAQRLWRCLFGLAPQVLECVVLLYSMSLDDAPEKIAANYLLENVNSVTCHIQLFS